MTTDLLDPPEAIATATGPEAERQAARREIRKQIAARDAIHARIAALRERVAALDREADQASDLHRQTCEPLQAGLQNIEAEFASAAADRKAIPAHLESRRLELINALENANERLSDTCERVRRLKAPLLKEINKWATEAAQGAALENKLMTQGLANPQLLIEKHCAGQAALWAGHRVSAARQQSQRWQTELSQLESHAKEVVGRHMFGDPLYKKQSAADIEQLEIMLLRAARWQAEVAAASAAIATTNAELNRILRELIAE